MVCDARRRLRRQPQLGERGKAHRARTRILPRTWFRRTGESREAENEIAAGDEIVPAHSTEVPAGVRVQYGRCWGGVRCWESYSR